MTNQVKKVPELRFPEFDGKWEEKKLGDIAHITMGQSPKSSNYTNNDQDMVLVQGNADMKKGQIYPRIYTTEITKLAEIDDILLSVRAPVGELAIAQLRACIGRGVCAINANKFVYYNLELFKVRNTWKLFSQGSTFESISGNEIKKINFQIPISKSEQQKIGEFFSKLDRQIELEEQKLAKLEEQKKGYMQKIFSQEIRFKDDNGNSYPEWESAPLFDIFSATKGKSLSKDKISNDGKYECILYGEIYTTYAEKIESIVSRTNYYEGILSQKNDLIFPNSTTTNAWDLATFSSLQKNNVLIGGDISILRTKRSDISSLFYAYYLTNYLKLRKDIAKYAQGITIVHLSFNNFYKIKVQIPSLEEQNSITDFIDSLNQQQKLITNKIKLLKERKKGFLQKMFV
ncbi:restriction endonuclease subunit S [Mammaliicoccus sciuri]|uniref:restriction endonuclease subunit S n=1 Tax=Mammaliicoccus sciuri TaxID=1296 RepID=UPI002DBD4FA4|nr:restriction endonuclease subunit S [Mammaliicoccus sciuri]MEB6340180.1 restriction endonuclease subunit S [Mammaliicoccus sciuri]